MPIEIRELVIRTSITESGTASNVGQAGSGKAQPDLVQEITDKVLDVLNQKTER